MLLDIAAQEEQSWQIFPFFVNHSSWSLQGLLMFKMYHSGRQSNSNHSPQHESNYIGICCEKWQASVEHLLPCLQLSVPFWIWCFLFCIPQWCYKHAQIIGKIIQESMSTDCQGNYHKSKHRIFDKLASPLSEQKSFPSSEQLLGNLHVCFGMLQNPSWVLSQTFGVKNLVQCKGVWTAFDMGSESSLRTTSCKCNSKQGQAQRQHPNPNSWQS